MFSQGVPLDSRIPLARKLAQLREVADSRYRKWQQAFAEAQKDQEDANLSALGRAARRLERRIEVLNRGVKERCAIQRAVSQEYSCPEMLSSMELNSLEQEMMREASHAVLALQQSNANDFFSAGDVSPASSGAAQERVAYDLPTQIRSVVHAELRVLRAEGAVQQDEKGSVEASAGAIAGLDDPYDAFSCAQTQIATFARIVAPTKAPTPKRFAVASTLKPPERETQRQADRRDERAVSDRRSGRKPNDALNHAIGEIVAGFGPDWRYRLAEICEMLV